MTKLPLPSFANVVAVFAAPQFVDPTGIAVEGNVVGLRRGAFSIGLEGRADLPAGQALDGAGLVVSEPL